MAYSDKVIDHYENPRNVGSFDKGDESVGTGMVGAPACGDVMKLQIKVNPGPWPCVRVCCCSTNRCRRSTGACAKRPGSS